MSQIVHKQLLSLLVKVYNTAITDYYYFPEIIFAGPQKLERPEFDRLLEDGFIKISKHDSFGRYYRHTKKCEILLHQQLVSKQHRKKSNSIPLNQGCLYFTRFKNPQASGARCLLFL